MSTYMENIYNNNENNNFQSTYDSIINELINLENLTPDKSRADKHRVPGSVSLSGGTPHADSQ